MSPWTHQLDVNTVILTGSIRACDELGEGWRVKGFHGFGSWKKQTPWKINGWFTYRSPMKERENDLNQTSMIMFHVNLQGAYGTGISTYIMEFQGRRAVSFREHKIILQPSVFKGTVYVTGQFILNPFTQLRPFWVGYPDSLTIHYLFGWPRRVGRCKLPGPRPYAPWDWNIYPHLA